MKRKNKPQALPKIVVSTQKMLSMVWDMPTEERGRLLTAMLLMAENGGAFKADPGEYAYLSQRGAVEIEGDMVAVPIIAALLEKQFRITSRNQKNILKRWEKLPNDTKNIPVVYQSYTTGIPKQGIPQPLDNQANDTSRIPDGYQSYKNPRIVSSNSIYSSSLYNPNFSQEKNKKNFLDRKNGFAQLVKSNRANYTPEHLTSFFEYWAEETPDGAMRFEKEKAFGIERRLAMWKGPEADMPKTEAPYLHAERNLEQWTREAWIAHYADRAKVDVMFARHFSHVFEAKHKETNGHDIKT